MEYIIRSCCPTLFTDSLKKSYAGQENEIVVLDIDGTLLGDCESHRSLQKEFNPAGESSFAMKYYEHSSSVVWQGGSFWIFPNEFANLLVELQKQRIQIGFYTHGRYDRKYFLQKLNTKMWQCNNEFMPLNIDKTLFIRLHRETKQQIYKLKCHFHGETFMYMNKRVSSTDDLPSKFEVLYWLFMNSPDDIELAALVDDRADREFNKLPPRLRRKFKDANCPFSIIDDNGNLNGDEIEYFFYERIKKEITKIKKGDPVTGYGTGYQKL